MDHTEKLEMTGLTTLEKFKEWNKKAGLKTVALTPDDILTLKQIRSDLIRSRQYQADHVYYPEWQRNLETLERILKQVG